MNSFSKNTFEVQPDKSNSVVILDEDVYIKNMKSLLSKKAKFEEADTTKGFTKFYCKRWEKYWQIFEIFKITRNFKCWAAHEN